MIASGSVTDVAEALGPVTTQTMSAHGNFVYGIVGGIIWKVNISTGTVDPLGGASWSGVKAMAAIFMTILNLLLPLPVNVLVLIFWLPVFYCLVLNSLNITRWVNFHDQI